jgi:hypothetical protein
VHGDDSGPSYDAFDKMFCSKMERKIQFEGGKNVYMDMFRAEMAKTLRRCETPWCRSPKGGIDLTHERSCGLVVGQRR